MKVKSIQVKNFKCVDDSTEFVIDPITCLVGKNEAGKTALLEALYKMNPVVKEHQNFEVLIEYPRKRRKDYEQKAAAEPDDAIVTKWELENEDIKLLEDALGTTAIKSKTVSVCKGYYKERKWLIELDETKVVEHLLHSATLDDADRERYSEATTIQQLVEALQQREGPSQDEQKFLQQLKETFAKNSVQACVEKLLSGLLPKFVYFSKYQILAGRVSIEGIKERQAQKKLSNSDRVFLALLDLVGTTPQEIESIGKSEELIADLEAASAHITEQIFGYWSQNRNLRVSFHLHPGKPQDPPPYNKGLVFETRILNTRQNVTLNFDERSTGFVWFFSFLVWFSQVKKNYGDNLVILLDDPGLGLHGKAQADLLRYISEKLEPNYQVIYTTHSPFMIDPDKLLRARTVEDVVIKIKDGSEKYLGTKVGDRVLSTDADTLFPLQAALGYEITQTLFVGKNNLLVEGPSDLLYLKWFSKRLMERGRVGLDPVWTIAPIGGIDKTSAFMALFGGSKLNVAVLLDFAHGQKRKVRDLKESELLRNCHVFSADMYVDAAEADIEDLIGCEAYFALVNLCYKLSGRNKLGCRKSQQVSPPVRVAKQVEDHFRTLPPDVSEFDHYTPAEYLTENGKELMDKIPTLEEAFGRFEKLFENLNACLPRE